MTVSSDESQLNIDSLLERLLEVRRRRLPDKFVQMSEEEIYLLCNKSKEIFLNEPTLLELNAPINVCGNIQGQYNDLLCHFEQAGFPPNSKYLFLGSYVDRGKQSLETICLLLAYKIKYPDKIFLLRGNHECASINRIYGFYNECKRRYNIKLWKSFINCFNCLPVAAIIAGKIFCCHGGLSPELRSLEQIRQIRRPTDVPDSGLFCDLLWSDPDSDIERWVENHAGVSCRFGADIVKKFLNQHNMDLICRAHQVVSNGYEFFADRRLVTVFSAPDYCGEFDNAGALMLVDPNLDDSLSCSDQNFHGDFEKKWLDFLFAGFSSNSKFLEYNYDTYVLQSSKKRLDQQDDGNLTPIHTTRFGSDHMNSSCLTRIDICQPSVKWADIDDGVTYKEPTLYGLYQEL